MIYNKNRINLMIIITLLYCSSFLINDFGYSVANYAMILLIIGLVIFFRNIKNIKLHFNTEKKIILLLMNIIVTTSINNLNVQDETKLYYLFIMFLSVFSLFVTEYSKDTIIIIKRIILFTGAIFSTLIYFYKILPNVYTKLIFPFLTDEVLIKLNRALSEGYSVFVYGELSYTLSIILFALYIIYFGDYKKKKLISMYYLGSLLFSQRRTEIIFGIFAIIFTIFVLNFNKLKKFAKENILFFKCFLISLIFILVILALFMINVKIGFTSDNRILMTLYELKYHIDTLNGRKQIYDVAINVLKNNWLFGIGWMNFAKYAGKSGIKIVRNVHNINLQVLLECGVFVGGLFIVLIFYLLLIFFKKNSNNKILSCTMMLYLMLAGLTDNTIYYPYFWVILCIIVYFSNIEGVRREV